jgi:hypothetical protein
MRLRAGAVLAMMVLGAGMADGQAPPAAPQITFEETAVVASGLTSGNKAVWFAVERRFDEDLSEELRRRYDVVDVAADGTARYALTAPASRTSFWVAVDLNSGAFSVAAPAGYPLTHPQKPSQLGRGERTVADEILDERPYLMGLVVRPGPGGGAWSFAGGDGGPRDEDGQNDGHLRFALDRFEPLAGSPAAPARVQADDLWFIVDPQTMQISVHKGGIAQ